MRIQSCLRGPGGRQFLKFLVVGGSGTIVNLAIFVTCVRGLGIFYMVASAIAFVCAVTWNYYWNRRWTFRWGGEAGAGGQYCEFFVVSTFALGVNLVVLRIAVAGLAWPAVAGQLAGIAVATLFNFAGNKLWVFSERRRGGGGATLPHVAALCLVLLAAVLLRSYGLSKESLWIDEAYSQHMATQPLARVLAAEKTNPPLYYTLLHFWVRIAGTSETGLRSLSVVPGVVAVLLVYLLGARLYTKGTALLAAGFLAVSSYHVYFAQEARCFALLLALLLGSMLSLDAALRGEPGKRTRWAWAAYFLTTVAALYTHFYAVFFVAAENLFFVVRWREHRRRLVPWVLMQAGVLLAFAPWLVTMFEAAGGGGQPRRYLLLKLPQALVSFLVGETLIPMDEAAVQHLRGTLLAHWHSVLAFAVGFGILFVAALAAARHHRRGTWFVVTMGLGPMLMALLVSLKIPLLDRRYLIGASPLVYLFLAAGVTHGLRRGGPWRKPARVILALGAAVAAATVCASLVNYYFHPRFGKEQWREVTRYVEARALPGDLVVFHVGYIGVAYDYYATRTDVRRLRLKDAVEDPESPEWRDAWKTISAHRRVWLVRSHFPSDDVLERFRAALVEKSHVRFQKAKGIDVYLLVRAAPRP